MSPAKPVDTRVLRLAKVYGPYGVREDIQALCDEVDAYRDAVRSIQQLRDELQGNEMVALSVALDMIANRVNWQDE